MQIILNASLFGTLQGQPPDWQDFIGILTLLVINSTISFIEENNAGNAAASLMARLAPKTKVCPFIPNAELTLTEPGHNLWSPLPNRTDL